MTYYFSKLTLTKKGVDYRITSLTWDSYNIHKEIWDLFPGMPDSERGFIYSVLDDGRTVYLISSREPVENNYWNVETKVYDPVVKLGDVFDFRLLANPTVMKTVGDKHKRHDVVMDMKKKYRSEGKEFTMNDIIHDSVAEWVVRKGVLNGFEVDSSSLRIHSYSRNESKKSNKTITFSTVVIEGTLRVTECILFRDCLFNGIGSAKGFGCGMLMIKRI